MSRCFPFPPPGYEKKARADDADVLKKEKQREKKHKKEKRDKEKREGKEKREKDRSDGKHRDKKDRKEKQRDKKKDKEKDRDKDKDKVGTSGEKRVADQAESYNGQKLNQKEKNRDKEKSTISDDEKKQAVQVQGHNGGKPIQNSLLSEETEDSKFVQELGRRIRDEENGAGSQLVERFTGTDQKMVEGMDRLVVKDTGTLAEGKEKNKDRRLDNRKMDVQGIRDDTRFSGNAMVQNIAGMVQSRVEGMPRPMEKNIERRMEKKEKSKEKEGDDKRRDKRTDKDREKKRQAKDKEREKEKKKEEKVKERSEHKNTEQDKFKDSNKNDYIGTHNIKTSHLPKDCDKNAASEGSLKKRKDLESNGILHDNDVSRPNKMPRPNSSHALTENGRKLEPCQTPVLFSSDKQGAANNLKKERKLNGIIEAQPLSISSKKPSSAVTQADHIAEASMKPPHPDSKYLSQVLSVPKMEEWSDFDDQEWLFSSNDPSLNKPEVGSVGVNETPRVWAEALQIKSADVCALPYVIPY